MNTNDYVKYQYLELPEHLWSDASILIFAQFMKENDSAEYQIIMEDIDFDDLHDSIVDDSQCHIDVQVEIAKQQVISTFKQEIRSRVDELESEVDDNE